VLILAQIYSNVMYLWKDKLHERQKFSPVTNASCQA